jgi:hypothetical protein
VPIAWIVREKSSSSRKCLSEYAGGLASPSACGFPAANNSSIAFWTRSSSRSSRRASCAVAVRLATASATSSLRFPNATEWSSTRTRPRSIAPASSPITSPRFSASSASVFIVSRRVPPARIFSNSGSIFASIARRSRCTTHTLMPSAPSRFAVASPNPLEPPRITAH